MSKIYCSTRLEAQALCDKIHARMIANVPSYARSVAAGQTLRWAVPMRDLDADGKEVGQYFVAVKDRCEVALDPADKLRIAQVVKAV